MKPRIRRIRDGIASEFATEFAADSRLADGFATDSQDGKSLRQIRETESLRPGSAGKSLQRIRESSRTRVRAGFAIEFASKDSWSVRAADTQVRGEHRERVPSSHGHGQGHGAPRAKQCNLQTNQSPTSRSRSLRITTYVGRELKALPFPLRITLNAALPFPLRSRRRLSWTLVAAPCTSPAQSVSSVDDVASTQQR